MIYALMVGEYDSRDIHSAYTDEEEAKEAGALIEAASGQDWEIIPVTFNYTPSEGEDVWSVVIEGGKVTHCATVGLAERWYSFHYENDRLHMQVLASTPEAALEAARDKWDSIKSPSRQKLSRTQRLHGEELVRRATQG